MARMTAIHYKDNKIIEQKTNAQLLDFDPSEGQDWNWEDYEWSTDKQSVGYEVVEIKEEIPAWKNQSFYH